MRCFRHEKVFPLENEKCAPTHKKKRPWAGQVYKLVRRDAMMKSIDRLDLHHMFSAALAWRSLLFCLPNADYELYNLEPPLQPTTETFHSWRPLTHEEGTQQPCLINIVLLLYCSRSKLALHRPTEAPGFTQELLFERRVNSMANKLGGSRGVTQEVRSRSFVCACSARRRVVLLANLGPTTSTHARTHTFVVL